MIGTMVLVLMGCGSAVFAGSMAGTVGAGVGTVGVALAFGLSVVAMAYAIGGISGCHINPAITLGVFLSGRMNGKDAGMYMLFQVIGAIIGSAILYALVTTGGYDGPTATGSNGFGDGEMLQAFIAEVVFTFIFVLVVLGSTDPKKGAGAFAGLAIGLSLVGSPKLLVLDEPINGLDPEGIKEIRDLILKLNHDRNITVLISSHILGELSRLATRYGIIHRGRLIEEFTETQLFERCHTKDGKAEMDLEEYFLNAIGGK